MQVSFSSDDIAAIAQAKASRGATTETIRGLAGLSDAAPGDLSFLGNGKYKAEVATTRASVVLVPADFTGEPKSGQRFLVVENPSIALARICARIEQSLWPRPTPGVHPSACVAPDAQIAESATVGPLCVVESGVVIGENAHLQAHVFVGRNSRIGASSWLMPGVVIAAECQIGARVQLQPGVVIGSDGFGYEFVKGRHEKLPQVGIVVIGDDVEIGSNTTIDRARFNQTLVGEGTKIDNLVQIGHNVIIGRHCMICGQVGISGSARLEDYVVLGGQVGVAGHIKIGKGVKAGGKSGLNADVAAGSFINGNPAIPYLLERRITVLHQRLPELFKRVETLEEQLLDAKKSSS